MSGIDKYAYKSKIAAIKASHKLLFACAMMCICLCFNCIAVSIWTIVAMSVATLFWGGCQLKQYLGLLSIPFSFLIIGVLTIVINQLTTDDIALLSFNLFGAVYGISTGSLNTGFNLFLKAFGAVTCLY